MVAVVAATVGLLAGTAQARAGIVFDGSPGTATPPPTLGPYAVTPFAADPQPLGPVTSVNGPDNATIGFDQSLGHVTVGDGWNTWSNGYGGDVYTTGSSTEVTVSLPAQTRAFYLYAEPDPYAVFTVTATSSDGTSSGPVQVEGYAGAQYFGFYTDGSTQLASITVSSSVDFAIGEFGIATGPSIKPGVNYVALGDSYSSGEGNPPFLPGTDHGSDLCHRSSQAYPEVLASALHTSPVQFYACSGATTDDLTSLTFNTEPPQLSRSGVDASANLVTMTIGGNDAGFADVIKTCIEQYLEAQAVAATNPVASWLGLGPDPSCASSSSFTSSVDRQIDDTFTPVKAVEKQLVQQTDPINTSIIVAGYPRIFPENSDQQNCGSLSWILTPSDQTWMNSEANRLNGVLAEAAGQAGVNFVDVRDIFGGHGVCGAAGAWINGLSLASGTGGACTYSVLGQCIIPNTVGSFHPDANGHSQGYAAAIERYVSSATNQTPQGLPANPTALPDPPGATGLASDSIGGLTVIPVSAQSSDCEGTFQAGQQLNVSGSGFLPGTSVRIFVSSPGLRDASRRVATLTADASGAVNAVIRIPLTATGFVDQGAPVGVVGIDAIGLAPDGSSHRDAMTLVGLAPHGAACGTVDPLPFSGFSPPVANSPTVNDVNPGATVPIKFTIAGSGATLSSVLASGYPQSAPVSCTAPDTTLTSGTPTNQTSSGTPISDTYNYAWQTNSSWTGCRELIVQLADGSYHRALFSFGP